MVARKSGAQRVREALLRHPEGITRMDFNLPNMIDGGDPILNFPDIILKLRGQGWEIETLEEPLANGGKAARYRLIQAPVAEAAGIPHTPPMAAVQPPRDGSQDGKEAEGTEVVDPDDPQPPTDPSGGQLLMFPEPPPKPVMGPYEVAA